MTDAADFIRTVQAHFPGAAVSRLVVILYTLRDRALAKQAIDRAPPGYAVDIKEAKRSDDQNRALWGLLNQIVRQRPHHNGVKMDAELWKCVFLQALGVEMKLIPTLDGDGFFPIGHRSSQLTVSQFSALIELMLAWTAREQLVIKHFDADDRGASAPRRERADLRDALRGRPAASQAPGLRMSRVDTPLHREPIEIERRAMSTARRAKIIARDGGKCRYPECEITTGLEVDHIVALALGGKDADGNLETLCHDHHLAKTKRDVKMISKAKRTGLKHRGEFPPAKQKLKGRGFERRWEG